MKEGIKMPSLMEYVKRVVELKFELPQEVISWLSGYCSFLSSLIQLHELIPCDKEGVPLEEYKVVPYNGHTDSCDCNSCNAMYDKYTEYQEALSRCKYVGFVWDSHKDLNDGLKTIYVTQGLFEFVFLKDGNRYLLRNNHKDLNTHEDLQKLGVYVTEESAKTLKII